MATSKIMIIRHAEKPSDDGSVAGIDANGAPDAEELIVRGWQRSGALVQFFAASAVNAPAAIFASGTAKHSKSLRPQHTVQALADFLKIQINVSHLKGDEDALVTDALAANGTILIAWEHEAIPTIANRILGDDRTCPQLWPGDRFDLVWILDREPAGWRFSQLPQMLLPGDRAAVI